MTTRIETGVAAVAATSLACAVAFAALTLLEPIAGLSVRSVLAFLLAAGAGFGSWQVLAMIGDRTIYPPTAFQPVMLDPAPAEEPLELNGVHDAPLVLDDVLHAVGPEARVVRLFDASAMPTPAELKAQVDRYLGQGASWAKSPDASQALVDALTELRRSLR